MRQFFLSTGMLWCVLTLLLLRAEIDLQYKLITAEFEQYIFRTFHSLREEFDKPTLPVLSGMLVYFSGRCLFVFDCALSVFVESFF